MGATHFLMKTLPRVASEMALHVLAYNLTRVINIMGIRPLMAAMRAWPNPKKGSSTPPDQNCYASTLPAKRFYTTKTQS
jgi:transposase